VFVVFVVVLKLFLGVSIKENWHRSPAVKEIKNQQEKFNNYNFWES